MIATRPLTRAQMQFLRAFHATTAGPHPEHWPSPAILRRWLRKPTFHAAYKALTAITRRQLSFQLLCSGLHALQNVHDDICHRDTDSGRLSRAQRTICLDLLKLVRNRLPHVKATELNEADEDTDLGLAET